MAVVDWALPGLEGWSGSRISVSCEVLPRWRADRRSPSSRRLRSAAPCWSAYSATPSLTRTAPEPPAAPKPPTGGKPGAGNTGVPAGVPLRVVTGDQVFNTAGQVISGLDIHGYVRIRAKNVTLRNSIVRGGAVKCNAAVIFVESTGSARIEDTDIVPTNPNACLDGVWAANSRLLRMDIRNVVDGVKAFDNMVVQDSYIHDLSWFASDPNQGGGSTHNDAVQTYEGNHNVLLRHNTMLAGANGKAPTCTSSTTGSTAAAACSTSRTTAGRRR